MPLPQPAAQDDTLSELLELINRQLTEKNLKQLPQGEPVKMLTTCPACLQGLSRYADDNNMPADYIVIEMARHILGENWLDEFVAKANAGGVEKIRL